MPTTMGKPAYQTRNGPTMMMNNFFVAYDPLQIIIHPFLKIVKELYMETSTDNTLQEHQKFLTEMEISITSKLLLYMCHGGTS